MKADRHKLKWLTCSRAEGRVSGHTDLAGPGVRPCPSGAPSCPATKAPAAGEPDPSLLPTAAASQRSKGSGRGGRKEPSRVKARDTSGPGEQPPAPPVCGRPALPHGRGAEETPALGLLAWSTFPQPRAPQHSWCTRLPQR